MANEPQEALLEFNKVIVGKAACAPVLCDRPGRSGVNGSSCVRHACELLVLWSSPYHPISNSWAVYWGLMVCTRIKANKHFTSFLVKMIVINNDE